MRRLIFFFTLVFVSLNIYATGQDGDLIYIDGKQWVLLGKPVYADSILAKDLIAALPKERSYSTANWDGYTAYWSIQEDKLCLDSILYEIYEDSKNNRKECVPSETLKSVFRKYVDGKHIVATWFNGNIRVARGKMIYYEHTGYERNFENERIVTLDHGKVCEMKDYQNYFLEGFSFDRSTLNRWPGKNMQPWSNTELREMFPLHIENYPELTDVKRIVFSIKRARVDAQGNLVECEVKVVRPKDAEFNPRLAAEMAEAMKAYHPWRVFFINGEFRAYGIEGYFFPYLLGE